MPRAMVGPGSEAKRSASSASICRGMNFSCCATSAISSPCASRACASARPTPSPSGSVKLPPLQGLVLGRAGEPAAQLVRERHLGRALPELALDAQREPQRLGARRDELVVLRDVAARRVHVALAVAHLPHGKERSRIVRVELERALEEAFGLLEVV